MIENDRDRYNLKSKDHRYKSKYIRMYVYI
jgi:hypothetical protein